MQKRIDEDNQFIGSLNFLEKTENEEKEKSFRNYIKTIESINNYQDREKCRVIDFPKLQLVKGESNNMNIKEGTVRQRTNGIFEARYYNIDGVQKSVYDKDKNNCIKKLKEAVKNKDVPIQVEKNINLSAWIEKWYKTYKEPYLKENSLSSINNCLKNYINPKLGKHQLNDIKSITIQNFLNTIVKPNLRTKVKITLGDIFKTAFNNQLLKFNPMLGITIKNAKKEKRKAFSIKQQNIFVESLIDKDYRILFLIYLYTGTRRNEVITKDCFKVDFKNDLIHINGSKTENAVRTIPLFEQLKTELENINYKSLVESYSPNNVTRIFRNHCKAVNLKGFCVHSLRHTFATRCLEAGIN